MPAAIYNLTIEQGADFSKSFVLKNPDGSVKDLTNHTARMQVRQYVFEETVLLEATTENGGITLNVVTGTLTVKFSSALTSTLTMKAGVYDIELINSTGEVNRLLKGFVNFDPEVTR
jgi:hypothetical protein